MPFYAQHGYGKSDKLSIGLAEGCIDGVIFSARDEKPDALPTCIAKFRSEAPSARLMIDPQLHLGMYRPAKDRYLPDYPHYQSGLRLSDFVGSKAIRRYVSCAIDYQRDLEVDVLVAPTVHVESFSEREHQVALNLASEAMEYHGGLGETRPLLPSFVIGEHAFGDRTGIDEFLDQLTGWELNGVYVVVARAESGYSQRIDANRLAHLMYSAHVLGDLNGIETVFGYSDIHGALLRAAGASAFASGWSQGCRRYHRGNFLQRKAGGRRPRLRYCSTRLLNTIFLGELEQIHDVDRLDDVLSGSSRDSIITAASSPESSSWDQRASEIQHWEALSLLDKAIVGDVEADLTRLDAEVASARATYTELGDSGVAFERTTRGDHLEEWADAIRSFRELADL